MAELTEEILDLNKRIGEANKKLIRLQSRQETLKKSRDQLVKEIRKAGYNPASLKEDRKRLQEDLDKRKKEIEDELSKAEEKLASIPE